MIELKRLVRAMRDASGGPIQTPRWSAGVTSQQQKKEFSDVAFLFKINFHAHIFLDTYYVHLDQWYATVENSWSTHNSPIRGG